MSGKEVLHDINLQIHAGETIGIIGSTGSGKTTLVNLIPRFYDVTEGKVWIDGCDVTMIDISRSFFADSSIHAILFCSLLLRLHSFDFSLCIFLAQAGQYFDMPEPGTYSMPHTVQCLAGNAVHRFVGVICNSPTKPMNL